MVVWKAEKEVCRGRDRVGEGVRCGVRRSVHVVEHSVPNQKTPVGGAVLVLP